MAKYTIPYTHSQVSPSDAFPKKQSTPRPIVPVILFHGGRTAPSYAIIDSGADDTLFPSSFADRLGFVLTQGRYYEFGGAGSNNQPAWFFDVALSIGTALNYKASVGFTPALESAGMGLLGQHGFFDRFTVAFDLRGGNFYIEE